jgi:hypothetical protein
MRQNSNLEASIVVEPGKFTLQVVDDEIIVALPQGARARVDCVRSTPGFMASSPFSGLTYLGS